MQSTQISTEQTFLRMVLAISLLLLVTWGLFKIFDWFTAGHVLFGLTIGLMIGMTKSTTVSSALPVFFTFAGGSIIALSITNNPTQLQMERLGQQLCAFADGAITGLFVGIFLQRVGFELPFGKPSE